MIIAAIYPVFLWIMVFRLRRTWEGLALAVGGTLAVWPVAALVMRYGGAETGLPVSRMVYGEMALIGFVALWLVSMRRRSGKPLCPYCRYDLTGLPVDAVGAVCPECGQVLRSAPNDPIEPFCLCCGKKLGHLDPSVSGHTCPACGADESDFGNWTRAKAVRQKAEADRARYGRSAR